MTDRKNAVAYYDTADVWIAPTLRLLTDTVSTYIGGRNIRCYGENNGFIKLMPQGGIEAFSQYDVYDLTYEWSPAGESTKDIDTLEAGSYFVEISDKLLCRDDSTFVLTQPDTLVSHFVIIDSVTCAGAGRLAVVATGGTTDYAFEWTPGPLMACLVFITTH